MTKVAAIGGYQAKLALVGEQGTLALDGAERDDNIWRPVVVEPAQPVMGALVAALDKLEPTPSALHALLNEKLAQDS